MLLDAKENFVAFGFKAEQKYIEDDDEDDDEEEEGAYGGSREKQLHRNFKMMLHSKKVRYILHSFIYLFRGRCE